MNLVESIKHLFLQFGAEWILYLLFALAVISLVLVVERALYYRSCSGNLESLARALAARLDQGAIGEAIEDLGRSRAIAATVAAAGLRLAQRGPEAVEKAMQSATALQRGRLERGLAFLGTLGNNAPFVGLFGTVIGIIMAFEELGRGGHVHSHATQAVTQVATDALMGSIAEALVATAVGIMVALPAVAAYNYFQRRVAAILAGTEVLTSLVLAYLAPAPAAKKGD